MKRFFRILLYIAICYMAFAFVVAGVILLDSILFPIEWYTATDIGSYGVITGNSNNDQANELFSAIFPPQIEDCFQDVTYSYKATNIDESDFEIYLEFVIEDRNKFQEYIHRFAPIEEMVPFEYDDGYLEYTYSDWYDAESKVSEGRSSIDSAGIAKVLFHPEDQRVITVALGVRDGGGACIEDFTCFFDRFQIDPLEYVERPDYNHQDIINGEHKKMQ